MKKKWEIKSTPIWKEPIFWFIMWGFAMFFLYLYGGDELFVRLGLMKWKTK